MTVQNLISTLLWIPYLLVSCSCGQNSERQSIQLKTSEYIKLTTTKDSILSNDFSYYGDSVFPGHKDLTKFFIKRYDKDTCFPMIYKKKDLLEGFEGFKNLGDINNDNKKDSIFILEPLNWCEYDDGQSYYFTDTLLPRLKSDSYCCHPANIFVVGDIDEDGVCEIGQYYSSCVSHYKSLIVYSLKNKEWKKVGSCIYDLYYMEIGKPYSYFVRKINKDKFEMLEITDLTDDKTKVGKLIISDIYNCG